MEFFAACRTRAASDAGVDRVRAHFAQHEFGLYAADLRQTGEVDLSDSPFRILRLPLCPQSKLVGGSPRRIAAKGWRPRAPARW